MGALFSWEVEEERRWVGLTGMRLGLIIGEILGSCFFDFVCRMMKGWVGASWVRMSCRFCKFFFPFDIWVGKGDL